MTVRARPATARTRPAALAVIDLDADSPAELDALLLHLVGAAPAVGRLVLRPIAGVDEGLVARLSLTRAMLTPHGGPAVTQAVLEALRVAGAIDGPWPPSAAYPEAGSAVEARALEALGRAMSPLAVDLLLVQARRWQDHPDRAPTARDGRLCRLIDPPLVAAVGPANVGKSSLLNALVGRAVAVVADEPGTTRDAVGALVDLGGLVVRWLDTPGRRPAQGLEARAIEASEPLIAAADLVVAVGDARSGDPRAVLPRPAGVVVAGRSDLGRGNWDADVAVSAATGAGFGALVGLVREAMVPDADMISEEPWKFW